MTSNKIRRRPPYAQQVEAHLKTGRSFPDGQHCVWIACGRDAWEQAAKTLTWGHLVMVLPPGECPNQFEWPVTGLDVVVLVAGDIDRTTLEALGTELVRVGSYLVVVCDPEREILGGPIFTFKPRRMAA